MVLLRALTVTSALGFALVPRYAVAQAVDQTAPATTEAPTVLSPFVVDASQDAGNYKANSTLAGTRVRTDLKDVASAISVVTAQFLQDTGSKNQEDLLVYTPSTEVTGLRGNFSGAAGSSTFQENTVSSTTRVRGLDQADNTRDYFLTNIPWDSFNVGRIDLQRGPNSILFGTGSPAGIVNASTEGAAFNNAYNITNRIDEFGSLRDSVSLNQEIIPGVMAIRLAALKDDERYEQVPAYQNTTRYYGAFRFDPKLFGKDSHTSLRANYEWGKVQSNDPRSLPPLDLITPWFSSSVTAGGVSNLGYNKQIINQYPDGPQTYTGNAVNVSNPSGTPLPFGDIMPYYFTGPDRGGWANVRDFYEGTPAVLNANQANPQTPTGTPFYSTASWFNYGLIPQAYGQEGAYLGTLASYYGSMNGLQPFSNFAALVGTNTPTGATAVPPNFTYPENAIPGGGYYADKVLTDPSVFNFYKLLLDGPNKREWKNWKAFNITLDQTFFNDRLGIEFAYDQEKYEEGSVPFLAGQEYAVNVDVNATYVDGTPNPNVGRPMVAYGASNAVDYDNTTTRQTYRITPTAEFRASDVFGNSIWAKIIGKHDFTGLFEKNTVVTSNTSYEQFALTQQWDTDNWLPQNQGWEADPLGSWNTFNAWVYIGPSLLNAQSAAGAHLNNIPFTIAPPPQQIVQNFNSTWNKPTNPSDPGYVDPQAPYVYTNLQDGSTNTNIQWENPANYVGWQQHQAYFLNADNPSQKPSLVTHATRTRYQDESEGITWQGYLLNGDLVPSLGWRRDKVTSYNSTAYTDPLSEFTSTSFPDNLQSRTDVNGVSKTWGGVYHFPKALMSKLPYDTTFSVLFDRSENFKPDAARLSLQGDPVPSSAGTTTEYGFVVTTLSEKISVKVDWFKTLVKNASLEDINNANTIAGIYNGYNIPLLTLWGYGWATSLQDGLEGKEPNTNYWNYGLFSDQGASQAVGSPAYLATNARSQDIINAWLNIPVSDQFLNSYDVAPAIHPSLAKASGQLANAFPAGYNDLTAPNLGGGSSFGNHVTTVDNESKGVEVELTAQPIRNWNVTLNYVHDSATHANVDPAGQAFISQLTGFYNGPGGLIRMWCNACGTSEMTTWNNQIVAPFTVLLNDQGHAAPEVSTWRLNLITTYEFDRGWVKGIFVGGAYRQEAPRILGYKYDPTFKNVNSDDPNYANVLLVTEGGLNVNEPFYGPSDHHWDAWVGYERKIYKNVHWRIQLNLQNVGEKDQLVPAQYEPDGSLALARIQLGMGWRLENSFDF